ncbi:hypothetical protein [Escherichia coli]|uniref:hypothetical protein n=1 Tax=Escherichia coli TaxID=562 RepID=UPI003263FDB7
MANFNAGDKVIHVSGYGPTMAVREGYISDGLDFYSCEYWSEKEGKFVAERFPETSLKAVDESSDW